MSLLPKSTFVMDVKVVILQLFNKSKLRNGFKTFLEPKFVSIVKFKKLGFTAPLIQLFFSLKSVEDMRIMQVYILVNETT